MKRSHFVASGTVAGVVAVVGLSLHHPAASLAAGSLSSSSAGSSTTSAPTSSTSAASSSRSAAASSTTAGTRSATGTDESFRYGDIAVKVTISGNKITHVGIATISETDGRSAQIDQYAVPQLEQQVLAAGSTQIDGVGGATFTSEAFVQSLASALSKLGLG